MKESERTKIANRLGALFKRTVPYTAWGQSDQFAFSQLLCRAALISELGEIERFKPRYQFFPHSLGRLLEKWDDILDASRNGDISKKPKSTLSKSISHTLAQIADIERRGY